MISAEEANFTKKEKIEQQIEYLNNKIKRVKQITGKKQGRLTIYGRKFEDEFCFYLKRKGYEVIKDGYYIEIWVR